MRVQATCLVQEGDQPLKFNWKKDGKLLEESYNYKISQHDDWSTTIVIDKASAEHSGNYTCEVTNPATISSTSAVLNVRGTVKFFSRLISVILYI